MRYPFRYYLLLVFATAHCQVFATDSTSVHAQRITATRVYRCYYHDWGIRVLPNYAASHVVNTLKDNRNQDWWYCDEESGNHDYVCPEGKVAVRFSNWYHTDGMGINHERCYIKCTDLNTVLPELQCDWYDPDAPMPR